MLQRESDNLTSTILTEGRILSSDYTANKVGNAELKFLSQQAAKHLGWNNKGSAELFLIDKGIDPSNLGQLRAYLMDQKIMTTGSLEGGLRGYLGFKKISLDDQLKSDKIRLESLRNNKDVPFLDPGFIEDQGQIYSQIENFKASITKPSSPKHNISGRYRYGEAGRSGSLDVNPVIEAAQKTFDFLTNEIKLPVVHFNPLSLLGGKDLSAMRKAGDFQIIPGRSNNPFVRNEAEGAELLTWSRTGGFLGSKGEVNVYRFNEATGQIEAEKLAGKFRPLSRDSKSMTGKTAEFASGEGRVKPENDSFLKTALNFDPEQSPSVPRFIGRMVNRKFDINNEAVMAKIISAKEGEEFSVPGFGRRKKLILSSETSGQVTRQTLLDARTGETVASHADLMEAFTAFADSTFNQGTPRKVADLLLGENTILPYAAREADRYGESLIRNFNTVTNTSHVQKIVGGFEESINALHETGVQLVKQGKADKAEKIFDQYATLKKGHNRLLRFTEMDQVQLSAESRLFENSPSILTNLDEFKSEAVRLAIQQEVILGQEFAPEVIKRISSGIDDLYTQGIITAAQRAEAQSSTTSTVFNLAAFETYNFEKGTDLIAGIQINPAERFRESKRILQENPELLRPFTEGSIAEPRLSKHSIPIRKAAPFVKKYFSPSKYKFTDNVSPISGDSEYTVMPTFSTALKRNPKDTLLSASGIRTYGNEEGFSSGSVPISHMSERLNRFFGTVGAGVDPNAYSGPLSMYAAGYMGQRVLPGIAIATTALAVDRELGGAVNDRDENGNKVYTPLVTTGAARVAVEARAMMSAITPGGMDYAQKKNQLLEGETAVRQGRWWALGNTQFKGGKIQYFRPSWYRRLKSAGKFTPEGLGTPMENLLYNQDYSPLRPIDPYRFEREHYEDRPYPLTGEYFTGPFGALTPALNMTVGKILKPQKTMHEEEVNRALASYEPAGESGAYLRQQRTIYEKSNMVPNPGVSYPAAPPSSLPLKPTKFVPINSSSNGDGSIAAANQRYSNAAGPTGSAAQSVIKQISSANNSLSTGYGSDTKSKKIKRTNRTRGESVAQEVTYGPPSGPKMMPEKIVSAGAPIRTGSNEYQAGDLGYKLQETAGIYGFGFGQIRQKLGLGKQDLSPDRAVLQSADKAYGSTRAFWDLNLGGMGDIPLPSQGPLGNIELSEIVRRLVPRERTDVSYLNPIKNTMGKKYPFLPGSDNFIDFTTGDPYTKVAEGEIRLPGIGYERFNKIYPGKNGKYGAVNQLDILADVAPFSREFKQLDRRVDKMDLSEEERQKVSQIRAQKKAIQESKVQFVSYNQTKGTISNAIKNPFSTAKEAFLHTDNFINNKFTGEQNATENWERKNVYGATFPEWQRPVESFIKPIYYKGTQRNPLLAGAIGATVGASILGGSRKGRIIGGTIGALTVGGYSAAHKISSAVTGKRFIPLERKKELALEEYSDILNYTKYTTAAARARLNGDEQTAKEYMAASRKTMYGTNLDTPSIDVLAAGIPKRKKDYFKEMITAPEHERKNILSTAGRLERRIYEAAWGMPVEKKPDLVDYFQTHELPGPNWEGWHPNTNMEHVKIKTGQSMGLEMSQMGYYPQQIKEANLTNPSYPEFGSGKKINSAKEVRQKLQALMNDNGINGRMIPVKRYNNDNRVNVSAGIR
jgi:hypothetical protein